MIDAETEGKRLDVYVAERSNITRSASQKLIERGAVTVNGESLPKNYKLRLGDTVDICVPEPEQTQIVPQDIPLDVVYEDDYLIVINKPKGMVVHPAPGNPDKTLVNALLHHCKGSLSGINGVIRPGIVHRIDKDTSGLLVAAKCDAAHESLASQIASHTFDRFYHAIVIGSFKEQVGTISKPIGRHPVKRKQMAVVAGGKPATTHYEVLEEWPGYSHIRLKLETGRTHQIRVHMSSFGHPIFGDTVYGGGKTRAEKQCAPICEGQCLHAKTISFIHPISGEYMEFTSELPDYFREVIARIKK